MGRVDELGSEVKSSNLLAEWILTDSGYAIARLGQS